MVIAKSGCALARADLAFESNLAHGLLRLDVGDGHDVGDVLAFRAVSAWRRLLTALTLPQMQPAHQDLLARQEQNQSWGHVA